jgi:hypothetical protein
VGSGDAPFRNASTFVLCDQLKPKKVRNNNPPPPPPPPAASRKKVENSSQATKKTPPAAPSEPVPGDADKICFKCEKLGHIWRFCPAKGAKYDSWQPPLPFKRRAMIGIVGEDTDDEDEIYEEAFAKVNMMTCMQATVRDGEFTATTVVFDSAAEASLFKNADLCHNVKPLDYPYYMGGVEKKSRGVLVDRVGDFQDLGPVHISAQSIANIVSEGELEDAGFDVQKTGGQYIITGRDKQWVFSRKYKRNGVKSRFFTCDVALASHHALTITVTEGLRRLTVRERHQGWDLEQQRDQGRRTTKDTHPIVTTRGNMNGRVVT